MDEQVVIKQATGECGKCHTGVYHDGMTWRHAENDRNLMHCPAKTADPDDIVALAKYALEGITAGPWENHTLPGRHSGDWVCEIVHPNGESNPSPVLQARRGCCWPPDRADAEFIAASRTLVSELVAEVERLRGLAKEYGIRI